MSDDIVFDRTIRLMQDRLSLSSLNQEIISSNLANINTPRYVAKELSFEKVLRESLEDRVHLATSSEKHIDPTDVQHAIRFPEIAGSGPVDLDEEMMKLSKNSIEYQFIISMLNKKFALLKHAIGEGGM